MLHNEQGRLKLNRLAEALQKEFSKYIVLAQSESAILCAVLVEVLTGNNRI